jgi:DNA-nicking Smr family endonuclease
MDDIDAFEADFLAAAREDLEAVPKAKLQVSAGEEIAKPPKKPSGQHQPLERPVKRKLAKGRLQLEARIDLHGLFQNEAHALLHSFILRAHERGLRHVLVITGKGSSMGSEGALKRVVPMWFSKPEFRHLISSYETSAQTHGGDGALYVRLSKAGGERT